MKFHLRVCNVVLRASHPALPNIEDFVGDVDVVNAAVSRFVREVTRRDLSLQNDVAAL